MLTVPEDVVDMGVDSNGNFVCSGGMRSLPVWTTQPDALCRQGRNDATAAVARNRKRKIRLISPGSSSRRSSNSSNSRRSSRKRATASRAGSRICSAVTDFDRTTRPP
ncbi:hypothetical protein LN650_26825 [Klebsiella pneumoniae subsp. pneumoniae]|nr:hypothetical protein [Klebsiella pneumoniae subsp. pneumoniae]